MITSEEVSREIERLKQIDVRDQYLKYMYQPLENRQYALGISGAVLIFHGPALPDLMITAEILEKNTSV